MRQRERGEFELMKLMKLMRYHSVEVEGEEGTGGKGGNVYRQKIEEFYERLKLHNESLILIVKAAMEAKNYWKAVSSNVFPDDDILNEQKQ